MMNYLKYIEHSAENLQFFLWYRDYCSRWEKLPESEKALAPEWTQSKLDAELFAAIPSPGAKISPPIAALVKETLSGKSSPTVTINRVDPFNTPPKTSSFDEKRDTISDFDTTFSGDEKISAQESGEQAFDEAGVHWKPCMINHTASKTRNHLTDTS